MSKSSNAKAARILFQARGETKGGTTVFTAYSNRTVTAIMSNNGPPRLITERWSPGVKEQEEDILHFIRTTFKVTNLEKL